MSKEQTDLRQLQSARIMMECGVRALSRTAFEGSEEATAFRNLGDTILANEGDVHGINIFKDVILSALDEAIARRASPSPAGGVQAVTDEMVERAFDAFLAAYSLPYEPGKDPRDGVRAALTAALSSQAQTTGGVDG